MSLDRAIEWLSYLDIGIKPEHLNTGSRWPLRLSLLYAEESRKEGGSDQYLSSFIAYDQNETRTITESKVESCIPPRPQVILLVFKTTKKIKFAIIT